MLVKEKEKDLEKAEEKRCLLIQDKKGETLKGLNQSWANLDHMVGFKSSSCLDCFHHIINITLSYRVYMEGHGLGALSVGQLKFMCLCRSGSRRSVFGLSWSSGACINKRTMRFRVT